MYQCTTMSIKHYYFSHLLHSHHHNRTLALISAFFSTNNIQQIQHNSNFLQNPALLETTNNFIDPLHLLQSFSTLTKTLSQNPRNFNALTIIDSLLNKTHLFDSASSLIIIDYLSRIKKLGRAKSVVSYLRTRGKVSDYFLYSLVFDCLVQDAKIHDVETVWAEICGSSSESINTSDYVIHVCKHGGFDEINGVFKRILMGARVLEKQSYIALIGALCRLNQGALAKSIVKEMHDKDLQVDDFSYFVMFQCFCKNGDLDEADFILRKLVKRKFHIDICIYGNFINALCVSGKFREAKKLFDKLTQRDNICKRDGRLGPLKEGRRVIFQLSTEGSVPKIMAYESYFRSLCNVGKLDEAEALLKRMMKSSTVPEICVYGAFIRALFRANRVDDALSFFRVERKKGFVRADEIAQYIIMELCEKGEIDGAVRIFDEIVETGGFVIPSCPNVYDCILAGYWRNIRVREAEWFFKRMQNACCGVSAYKIMISGYCNNGNVSKALCLFDEMMSSKMVVNGSLYEMIIRGLCDCGRLKEALKHFNDMIEKGHLVSCKRWKILFRSTCLVDD